MELPSALAYFIGFVLVVGVVLFLVNSFLFPHPNANVNFEQNLTRYISSTLNGRYYVNSSITPFNSTLLSTNWTVGNTNITGVLIKNSNGDGIKKMFVFVEAPYTSRNLDVSISNAYFQKTDASWTCAEYRNELTPGLCYSSYNVSNDKFQKVLIVFANKAVIQMCEIPEGSDIYRTGSC